MAERTYTFDVGTINVTADDLDDAHRYALDDIADIVRNSDGKPPRAPRVKKKKQPFKTIELSKAEHSMVLAALRLWQATPHEFRTSQGLDDVATDGGTHKPLTAKQIDALCQRINNPT